ncbi:hypothetical protein JTE90_018986 [Oedothorax gibbosus]|uniref:Uncharacterized protein n=1 Tax=Oedothorax gibbosus TaxID=931172 RepID=A0AAV6U033_9ARAC|nr:hypothetical protein JTE90_018986 [Oedothorax gibbosus]
MKLQSRLTSVTKLSSIRLDAHRLQHFVDVRQNVAFGRCEGLMSEEKAAEKIQASFKGYKTRKTLKDNGILPSEDAKKPNGGIEAKVKELADQPSGGNATKPNSAAATAAELEEILAIDLTDKDLEKAAHKIQASYRNFTKKKIATTTAPAPEEAQDKKETTADEAKVDEENLEDIDLGDPEVEKAALKIQSTFRGYKTRKVINTDGQPLQNGEKEEDED